MRGSGEISVLSRSLCMTFAFQCHLLRFQLRFVPLVRGGPASTLTSSGTPRRKLTSTRPDALLRERFARFALIVNHEVLPGHALTLTLIPYICLYIYMYLPLLSPRAAVALLTGSLHLIGLIPEWLA